MKLDNENDRKILLDIIYNAQIPGSGVILVADLVQRISSAVVETPDKDRK